MDYIVVYKCDAKNNNNDEVERAAAIYGMYTNAVSAEIAKMLCGEHTRLLSNVEIFVIEF